MRILVVGGGGREHALVWKILRSPRAPQVVCAPGNAGIAEIAETVAIAADDIDGLVRYAAETRVDLTVVGPEQALCAGIVDVFTARHLRIFGPTRMAARLEGSKVVTKELLARHGIPTAAFRIFADADLATAYARAHGGPLVVKADGLAAGKGVAVCDSTAEACSAIDEIMGARRFGAAGDRVVVEERLQGEEVSVLALTDGETVIPLAPAQDHKRVGDGDAGPNTGGMGAYSPVPFVDEATAEVIRKDIFHRTVEALEAEGVRYRGVLYAGLMLTADGPKLLEYNARFGDPETQVVIPRLGSDLLDLLLACVEGRLSEVRATWRPEACVTIVCASGGYPGTYETELEIEGLAAAGEIEDAVVFHAGTAERGGRVVTSGGRVLAVSGLGATIGDARARAYEACSRIAFQGMHLRRDIAQRAAEEEMT